jgi:CheY-like chemotaxis protein
MSETALILTLGKRDENQRLLAEALRGQGYSVERADDPTRLQSLLSEMSDPRLAIIDIDGYDATIWDVSEACQAASVAVIVVTSADADRVRREASDHGVDDVQEKPLEKARLETAIDDLL